MTDTVKHRLFMRFYLGFVISEIGTQLFDLSIFWYVQEKTHNPSNTAWLGLAVTLPQLFMFFFGVLADRYNRRHVMIITDILSAIIVTALTIFTSIFHFSIPLIAILFALLNISHNIFFPASRAFLPSTLPEEKLVTGNSLFAMGTEMAAIVAGAIGALLFSRVSFLVFFLINAFTFIISAVNLFLMGDPAKNNRDPEKSGNSDGIKKTMKDYCCQFFQILLKGSEC